MAHLSLSLLGTFEVTLGGQPITGFKSNKERALLAYLAVEADRSHRREVLAGLLWPDWPDRDALNNLRYTLSDLRRVIGDHDAEPPFLLITRDTLQFNLASDHSLDVATFTQHLADSQSTSQPIGESAIRHLQSAISLSRLWQSQGKRAEAHRMLAEIYDWFTEGFDTPDLQEAKALLQDLAR